TSPVAFGALGTPIITLAQVTLPQGMAREAWEFQISQMAGRQLPFFSLLVPAWLVFTMAGWRGVRGVWPALLVCGGRSARAHVLSPTSPAPSLAGVGAGLVALVALALSPRVWRPAAPWRFAHETAVPPAAAVTYSRARVLSAWVPWVLLSLFVFLWGV